MAFPTVGGKSKNSKFRQSRYNKENAPAEQGQSSRAHELTGTTPSRPSAEHEDHGSEPGTEQSKARELHMSFDDEGGVHHVHAVHDDGTEEHSDHASRDEAMYHGAKKAGLHMPDREGFEDRAREPQTAENEPDADDYAAIPL